MKTRLVLALGSLFLAGCSPRIVALDISEAWFECRRDRECTILEDPRCQLIPIKRQYADSFSAWVRRNRAEQVRGRTVRLEPQCLLGELRRREMYIEFGPELRACGSLSRVKVYLGPCIFTGITGDSKKFATLELQGSYGQRSIGQALETQGLQMFKTLLFGLSVFCTAGALAQLSQPPSFPTLGFSLYEKPKENPSVSVAQVAAGTPAAAAGFSPGDLVLRMGERPVSKITDVIAALNQVPVGASIEIVVRRGEQQQTLRVTPDPRLLH